MVATSSSLEGGQPAFAVSLALPGTPDYIHTGGTPNGDVKPPIVTTEETNKIIGVCDTSLKGDFGSAGTDEDGPYASSGEKPKAGDCH